MLSIKTNSAETTDKNQTTTDHERPAPERRGFWQARVCEKMHPTALIVNREGQQ